MDLCVFRVWGCEYRYCLQLGFRPPFSIWKHEATNGEHRSDKAVLTVTCGIEIVIHILTFWVFVVVRSWGELKSAVI